MVPAPVLHHVSYGTSCPVCYRKEVYKMKQHAYTHYAHPVMSGFLVHFVLCMPLFPSKWVQLTPCIPVGSFCPCEFSFMPQFLVHSPAPFRMPVIPYFMVYFVPCMPVYAPFLGSFCAVYAPVLGSFCAVYAPVFGSFAPCMPQFLVHFVPCMPQFLVHFVPCMPQFFVHFATYIPAVS